LLENKELESDELKMVISKKVIPVGIPNGSTIKKTNMTKIQQFQ
jgi:hypothetical protein